MDELRIMLMEAIARQQIVETRYNGETIKLAPHLLFERHGDLFIGALNLGKNWRPDDEPRLGQFKLAGLGGAELLDQTFEPLPTYQPATPRAEDTLVLAIQAVMCRPNKTWHPANSRFSTYSTIR